MKKRLLLVLAVLCLFSVAISAKTIVDEWTLVDEFTLLDSREIDSRDNLGAFGVRAGQYWSETQYGLYRVYASNGRYSYEDDRVPYNFSDVAPYDATVVFNNTTREETWYGLWTRWVEYDDGTIEQVEYEYVTITKIIQSWGWSYRLY